MSNNYLYEELDVLKKVNALKELPEYISNNLSPNIVLCDYQEEAFRYFITNYEQPSLRKVNKFIIYFTWQLVQGKLLLWLGLCVK